jgi:hypothetical protein
LPEHGTGAIPPYRDSIVQRNGRED